MRNTILNILYAFDNNYAPYTGISMTSLFENNISASEINIFVMGFDLSKDNIEKLQFTAEKYGRNIIFLDQSQTEQIIIDLSLPSYRGASVAAARLFISYFINENVEKILYLDSDTIIKGDLCSLFRQDLHGNPVGMVIDSVARDYKKLIGFSEDEPYYNAGVILYDLKRWNELSCTEKIIKHANEVRNNYAALDQDFINIVLKNQITTLDLTYNFEPYHIRYSSYDYLKVWGDEGYYSKKDIEEAYNQIKILHCFRFVGVFPWHKGSLHPCTTDYLHYKEISYWKDLEQIIVEKKGISYTIQKFLYHVFPNTLYLKIFRVYTRFSFKKNNKAIINNKQYYNI